MASFENYFRLKRKNHLEKERILELTKNFTEQTLGELDPKHMCFSVCFPLSSYLSFHNIPNKLIHGIITRPISHFVLSIYDDNRFILDPTIRQFYNTKPAIYFGPVNSDYRKFGTFSFLEAYADWKYILLNHGRHKPFPPDIPDDRKPFDIKILLGFHLKIYKLLQVEIKSKYFNDADHFRLTCMYISAIDEALKIY